MLRFFMIDYPIFIKKKEIILAIFKFLSYHDHHPY